VGNRLSEWGIGCSQVSRADPDGTRSAAEAIAFCGAEQQTDSIPADNTAPEENISTVHIVGSEIIQCARVVLQLIYYIVRSSKRTKALDKFYTKVFHIF
jgi:hypothetical protein